MLQESFTSGFWGDGTLDNSFELFFQKIAVLEPTISCLRQGLYHCAMDTADREDS